MLSVSVWSSACGSFTFFSFLACSRIAGGHTERTMMLASYVFPMLPLQNNYKKRRSKKTKGRIRQSPVLAQKISWTEWMLYSSWFTFVPELFEKPKVEKLPNKHLSQRCQLGPDWAQDLQIGIGPTYFKGTALDRDFEEDGTDVERTSLLPFFSLLVVKASKKEVTQMHGHG